MFAFLDMHPLFLRCLYVNSLITLSFSKRGCLTTITALKGCKNELLKQNRVARALIHSKRSYASVVERKIELHNVPQTSEESQGSEERLEKISKAMAAYLKNAKAYNDFIEEQRAEFEMGKRHLCNIMGWDPASITQKDINSAIQYLMPSGLFHHAARPVMYPPELIYEKRKEAEFDIQGRPHHSMFYTKKPNYHKLLHELFNKLLFLNSIEDDMIRKGVIEPHVESKATLLDSQWLAKKEFNDVLLEQLTGDEYTYLIHVMDNLLDHPYSTRVVDFLKPYRKEKVSVSSLVEIPPLLYTEDGRPYMTALGRRNYIKADVTVWGNGTGKVTINGEHDLLYFPHFKEREQVMFPLHFTELLMKVDVEAKLTYYGPKKSFPDGVSSQAGAMRHGISLALRSFVDTEIVEDMRICGLLTRDHRQKERKKPAHRGARKRFAYRKR